jgi:tetratricopeptide (TPR) repeat protein
MSRIKLTHIITSAALVLASSAPAFAQSPCDPQVNHYRVGGDQYAVGDYTAAFQSYGCFLTLYPADAYPQQTAEALNMRGNALREQGDLSGALEQYTQAVTVQPDYAIAYNNRGWAQFLLDEDDAALADYTLAISYDPSLAYAFNNRGLLYQYRGDLTLAAQDFERALALGLAPADWAEYNLNLVELVENRTAPLALDPNITPVTTNNAIDALLNEGIAADARRDWSATVAIMSEVLASDPNNSTAFYLRGRSYIALDRFAEAFADFDALVSLTTSTGVFPGIQYAHWERSIAAAQIGDFELARADVAVAVAIEPGHVNNFIARGTIAALAGDDATAGAEFLALMLCWEQERITLPPTEIGEMVSVEMQQGRIVTIPFEGNTEQVITIIASSATVDPVIVLIAPNGTALSGDDDSGFMLSSLIEGYTLPVDGTYMLQISHAGGGSVGTINVVIGAE